jgi:hypothetical protein
MSAITTHKATVEGDERFAWNCAHCSNRISWKKAWNPEGRAPLRWTCSYCRKSSKHWCWFAGAGWQQVQFDEDEFDGKGQPRLDHEMRWLFVCECTSVHRPHDFDIETEQDIQSTEFAFRCKCGREREFQMQDGKWVQMKFIQHELPVIHEPEKPIADDSEVAKCDPITVKFECGHCPDVHEIEAGFRLIHFCERCGSKTDLTRHAGYICGKCGNEFTFDASKKPFCMECHNYSDFTQTGKIEWESTPSLEGALNTGGEFEEMLFGRDGDPQKPGMLRHYEKADAYGRHKLAFEARLIADAALRFMVTLASEYQDYDAVRWLAYHSELGKCFEPADWIESIEDMLTKHDDKAKAKREWDEVKKWVKDNRPNQKRSVLATLVLRTSKSASWMRFRIRTSREELESQKLHYNGDPKRQEWQYWTKFLEGQRVFQETLDSEARMRVAGFAFPEGYMSSTTNKDTAEALVVEVLLPLVKWLKKHRADEWLKDSFPKFEDSDGRLNEADMERRIREVLSIPKKERVKGGKSASESNPVAM